MKNQQKKMANRKTVFYLYIAEKPFSYLPFPPAPIITFQPHPWVSVEIKLAPYIYYPTRLDIVHFSLNP